MNLLCIMLYLYDCNVMQYHILYCVISTMTLPLYQLIWRQQEVDGDSTKKSFKRYRLLVGMWQLWCQGVRKVLFTEGLSLYEAKKKRFVSSWTLKFKHCWYIRKFRNKHLQENTCCLHINWYNGRVIVAPFK
jgi:hypothetical protein